jgi:hypothetical protein
MSFITPSVAADDSVILDTLVVEDTISVKFPASFMGTPSIVTPTLKIRETER